VDGLGTEPRRGAERASDQTATRELGLAIARPDTMPGLPTPLAPSEAARLRRIFDLQARGEHDLAARETDRLEDRRLLGHVLADRWLRDAGRARAEDLQAWLAARGDHPDAPEIHALLARRLLRGTALPPAPEAAGALNPDEEVVPEEREPAARRVARNPAPDRQVRDLARDGHVRRALDQIARTRGMTPAYAALLKGEMALVLFQQGRDEAAFRLASEAARHAHGTGQAAFAAGLAAWGMGRHDLALPYFEAAARAEGAPAVLRSAAACCWTARAAIRARKPQHYVPWMVQAAQEPRTFYGLVARRPLGLAPGFAWEREIAGEAEGAALAETAAGWRTLALLQVGQVARAEAELRRLWPSAAGHPGLGRAMMVAASQAGMTHLAAQIAALVQGADGCPRDLVRVPAAPAPGASAPIRRCSTPSPGRNRTSTPARCHRPGRADCCRSCRPRRATSRAIRRCAAGRARSGCTTRG
jgi:soluble lytic murein transglycosylase